MIYLSRADVERLLDVKTAIDRMRDAFVAIAEEKVQLSKRTLILLADRAGFFGSMLLPASGFGSAAKVMTIYPGNHDAGLESHQGYILLFEEEHDEAVALIEAGS